MMITRAAQIIASLMLLACVLPCRAAPSCAALPASWDLWSAFRQHYVTDDGRVVDASTPQHITTSEGQSYALLFALAANDRAGFDMLLSWTENNLAQGNLREHLPAWQWGRTSTNTWQVLDNNPASDADLWIAYTLLEAARLWHEPRYRELGLSVASNVLRDEVLPVPGLGHALLPGPRGFVKDNIWRFNASYLPLPVLRRLMKEATPKHQALWQAVLQSSLKIIAASAPHGFAADWIGYRPASGFMPDPQTQSIGSYNAIRVYLWVGMTSVRDADNQTVIKQLTPAIEHVLQTGQVFESVDTQTAVTEGIGSSGFAAAFTPLLQPTNRHTALAQQARVQSLKDNQHYYSDVLTLFGLGWLDGWIRFNAQGQLIPAWRDLSSAAGSMACAH